MNKRWKGFVFVDINDDLLKQNHDLGCGLSLRKATLQEISDNQVKYSFQSWSERRGTSVFLNQRMPSPNSNNPHQDGRVLPNPDEWRHAVIECSNTSTFFWNVNIAFALSSADLRMGVICFEDGAFSNPYVEFSMLNVRNALGAMFVDHTLPSLKDLPEVKQNISYVLKSIADGIPKEILKMLHMFNTLDNLPDSSLFKSLGYFAIIEGLLSHAPHPSDKVDSIQRQLVRNIKLLNNRLKKIDREIDFGVFGETKIDNVLKRFYAYRSAIAHGNNVESKLDDISKIIPGSIKVDNLWVHDWLRGLTKKLLISSVIEPDLVLDLK